MRRHLLLGFAAAASLLIVLGVMFGVARSTPILTRAPAQASPVPVGMCVVNRARCDPQLPTARQAPSAPVRPVALVALSFVAVGPSFFVLQRRRAERLALGVRPPILHPPRLLAGVT